MLTVGSLFSGIGGLDLGLERAGLHVKWQSEIDPYACKVLAKHWPNIPNYGDIKQIDWRTVEPVDVICGGYPCQPFSTAGKRKGKDDSRHLWPYVLDAIRALRPRFVVLENVRGHLSLGFRDVLGDLAASGYDAEWQIIPASSLGAPHRRDRLVVLAYPSGRRLEECEPKPKTSKNFSFGSDEKGTMADAEIFFGDGSGYRHGATVSTSNPGLSDFLASRRASGSENFGIWQTEPDVGRVADGIPSRVDRLKGLGNAVVPQLGELIGLLLVAHDR